MKHTIGMGDEESAIEKTHNLQATEKEVKSTGFVVKKTKIRFLNHTSSKLYRLKIIFSYAANV